MITVEPRLSEPRLSESELALVNEIHEQINFNEIH